MAERNPDLPPEPKDEKERTAGHLAYAEARTHADQAKVLRQFPWLAGLDWKRYQAPEPKVAGAKTSQNPS
jgi:hypothetical protein